MTSFLRGVPPPKKNPGSSPERNAHHLKLHAAETNLEDLLQSKNLVMFILAFSGSFKSLSHILYLISLGLVPIQLPQVELLYLLAVAFSERNLQRNGLWPSVTAKRIAKLC